MIRFCLSTCLLFITPDSLNAQPVKDTLFINTADEEYPVYKYLHIYATDIIRSPDFVYDSLNTVNFSTLSPQRSFTARLAVKKHYWLLLNVKNNLQRDETFYYQLNSQTLNVVRAFVKDDKHGFSFLGVSGSNIPFRLKAYHYYDVVFPVSIKSGEALTLLLTVDNDDADDGNSIHFLPQFRSANIFRAEEERFYIVTGLITGVMLLVFLFNIFLGIALKEKLHLLYGLYILVALYEIYSMKGIDIQYIYPGHPLVSGYLQYFSPCILGILMTAIMQSFLGQTKKNSRVKLFVDIGLWSIVGMIIINGIIFLVFPENRFLVGLYEIVLAVLLFIQCLLFITSAIEKVIQGYKPAWYYLAAVLVFLIGLIEFIVMVLFGNNQESVLKRYPNDIEIGIVVETMVVFLGIVYRYNLYKKEKENLLEQLNMHQQNLIKRIVAAEEAERKRIAEDLHDDVGATLSTLSMHLSNPQENVKKIMTVERYNRHSLNLSNKAFNDIRTIAHNLLPKDFIETGLFLTLEERINELNITGPIKFTLIAEGNEKELNDVFAITIYRIINELLTNICKHSLASEAAIQILIEEKEVQIMTEDDGVGFKSEDVVNGIGLKNIKGRVEFLKGEIHIDSNEDSTHTVIHIPL